MRVRTTIQTPSGVYPTDWQGFGLGCGPYGLLLSRESDWSAMLADKSSDLSHLVANQGAHAWSLTNSISDSLGKSRVHECIHDKWTVLYSNDLALGSIIANGTFPYKSTTYRWEVYRRYSGYGLLRWALDNLPGPSVVTFPIEEAWLSRAMDSSSQVVSPDLDLAAEIFQLKDLGSGIKQIANTVRQFSLLGYSPSRFLTRSRTKFLKQLKDLVGSHLAWKWGVFPVYQDCVAVDKIISDANRRFRVLKQTLERGYRQFHAGYQVPPIASESHYGCLRGSVHTPSAGAVSYSLTGNYTSSGRYGVSCIQRFFGDIANLDLGSYIAMRTGLDKPLSSIWELVPYSFVLDYFLNLDQLLNEFQSLSADIRMRRTDGCKSQKFWGETTFDLTCAINVWDYSVYPYVKYFSWNDTCPAIAGIQHSQFARVPMEFTSHFQVETWKKRIFTLAELALQRVPHR